MLQTIQIQVGGFDHNFSYILYDQDSGDAAIVDPCGNTGLIQAELQKLSTIHPRYILITHDHSDHISGLAAVQEFFPAAVISHPACGVHSELPLSDHQHLQFGKTFLEAIFTPGHAVSSVCWLTGDHSALFTGDTLFIGCCGFCHCNTMYHTMREKLFPLPDEAIVYSGHDYGDTPTDTLGHQKQVNPFLSLTDYTQFCQAVRDLV